MTRRRYDPVLIAILCLLAAAILVPDPALAQTPARRPFGVGDSAPAVAAPGAFAWIFAKQAELTRGMISALRASTTGAGVWALLSLAFGYGVFHAAGPGHGKAVVMSYVFANDQAMRRGIGVAFAAAILQALVAIALVLPAILILGATARQIDASVAWIEIISFSAILLLGLSLTYRKLMAFRAALSARKVSALAPATGQFSASGDDHVHDAFCDHGHLPQASEITGEKSWGDLAAVTFAAGSRPCSGAILLLAFALSVGAYGAGIAAVFAMAAGTALTTAGFALGAVGAKSLTLRIADRSERLAFLAAGLELVAAILVAMLGLALLLGYLSGS